MKSVNLALVLRLSWVCSVFAIEPAWTASDRDWEAKQVAMWRGELARVSTLSAPEKFEALALGLRNMGYRVSVSGHSNSVDDIYAALRQEFLSIPGHATFFRDKIKAAQEEVKAGKLPLWQWDNLRRDSFDTLQHMPSEETVEVLMGFVNDNFADQLSKNPEDYKIPGLGPNDSGKFKVNTAACSALSSLGIEPMPQMRVEYPQPKDRREMWMKWWQEVKTGKRKYRFKGSSVEHPINTPPGAPREVRRPERHPERGVAQERGKESTSPESGAFRESRRTLWPMILGGAVFLVSLVFYWIRGRR